MKKHFSIILLLLVTTLSYAKDSGPQFGVFIIGQTQADAIYKLYSSRNANGIISNFREQFENIPADYKVYNLNEYKLGDILLYNIDVIFYNNVLIYFSANEFPLDELKNVISYKNGKPRVKLVEKKVQCVYRLTGVHAGTKKDMDLTYKWDLKGNTIRINSYNFYDENCKSIVGGLFEMYSNQYLAYQSIVKAKKKEKTDYSKYYSDSLIRHSVPDTSKHTSTSNKLVFDENEIKKMTIVRISQPISMNLMCDDLKLDSIQMHKWNPDYDLYMFNTYPTDFYNLRIPKDKLDLFVRKKEYLTKKTKQLFNDIVKP